MNRARKEVVVWSMKMAATGISQAGTAFVMMLLCRLWWALLGANKTILQFMGVRAVQCVGEAIIVRYPLILATKLMFAQCLVAPDAIRFRPGWS
jgi:hypothetical protein